MKRVQYTISVVDMETWRPVSRINGATIVHAVEYLLVRPVRPVFALDLI